MRVRSGVKFAVVAVTAATLAGCGGGDGDGGDASATADGTVEIEAGDLYFDPEEASATAGEVEFTLTNVGAVEHDLVIEEADDATVAHAEAGESATGSIELEPGTYTYYCAVPGHRSSMEGTLEVE